MNRAQRRAAARAQINRANAQHSTGPKTPEGIAISSQNRTTHGLTRHNGVFALLPSEDPTAFAALKDSLAAEHQPTTETESILVNSMAESLWLSQRAQTLQTASLEDPKLLALYMRYETTHTRAFHKSLNDLLKLRAEKRKAEHGFEAQKLREEELRIKNERHEMKKERHQSDIQAKNAKAAHQASLNALENLLAGREFGPMGMSAAKR